MSFALGQMLVEELLKSPLVNRTIVKWFSRGVVHEVRRMVTSLEKVIGGYSGPKEFEADWKWVRLMVPLQLRLLVEQILWDKRGGWRDLVTGFGPVKGRGRRPPIGRVGRSGL